ncbi:MAG: hypothetical protein M1840_001862 [Geoglossum simile]|nr:MAG: hypothetical protein M1840_001862 [Geoglossum simile]
MSSKPLRPGSASSAAPNSSRSKKRLRQDPSESSYSSDGGGYAIALRSIRRQIETLKRDEETRYLGAMAHLDALDDAITDITKGQKRDKRKSKKRRRRERRATSRESTLKGGATQADEGNRSGNEVSVARDESISHGGEADHEQATNRIATPSPLNTEAPHPPDDNLMTKTQDDIDRTPSDGSTIAGAISDVPTDKPRSSSSRQGSTKTESGNHIVPQTTHDNATNQVALGKKMAKIYFIRHRVQKILMPTHNEIPNEVVLNQISEYFASLEGHTHIEEKIFQQSKIHKVMRGIVALHSVPGDDKYHFKRRARALLLQWGKPVASSHGALSAADSIADSPIPSSERPGSSSAQSITNHTGAPTQPPRDTSSSQPAFVQKADLFQAKARLRELLEDEDMAEEEKRDSIQYHLGTLESIASPDPELIKAVDISGVLEAIIRQPSVPREAEFHFKRRANTILNNWNKILLKESTALKPRNTKWGNSNAPVRNVGPVVPPTAAVDAMKVTNRPLRDPVKTAKLKWLGEAMSHLNTVQSKYISNPTVQSAIVGILEEYKKEPPTRVGGFKAKTILPYSPVGQTRGSRGGGPKDIDPGSTVVEAPPAVKPKSNTATEPMRAEEPEQVLPNSDQREEHVFTPIHYTHDPLPAPRTPTQTKLPEPRSAPIATMVPRTGGIPLVFMSEKARGKQRMAYCMDDAPETVIADHGSPSRKHMGQNITRFLTSNQGVPPAAKEEERHRQLKADEALAKRLAMAYERDDEEMASHLQEQYSTGIYDSEHNIRNTSLRAPSLYNEHDPENTGQCRHCDGGGTRTVLNQDTEMVDAPLAPEKRQDEERNRDYLGDDGDDAGDGESSPYASTRNNDQATVDLPKPATIIQDSAVAQDTNGSDPKESLPFQGDDETTENLPEEIDDGIEILSARPVLTKIMDWDSPRRNRQPLTKLPRQQNVSTLHDKDTNTATVTELQTVVSTVPDDDDDDDDPPRKSIRRPRAQVEDARYSSFSPQSSRSHFKGRLPPHRSEVGNEDEDELVDNGRLGIPKIKTRDERVSSHTASPTPLAASPTPFRSKTTCQVARVKEERVQNAARIKNDDLSGAIDARQPQQVPPRAPANVSATVADIAAKSANLALNTSLLLRNLDEKFPINRSSAPDNPVLFSRIGISHVIGSGHMKTFVPLKPEASSAYQVQKAVFVKKGLSPFHPRTAMKHGVMYTTQKHEWKEGENALLFCQRQSLDCEYVGTYKIESWTMMMKDEWSSMPDRFRRQWAKYIKDSKDGWSTLLLKEAGFLREPDQKFSWEDVMELFVRDNKPKLRIWRGELRCIGFNYANLYDPLNYSALQQPN